MERVGIDRLLLKKKDRQQIYNPDDSYIFYDVLTPRTMRSRINMILVYCAPHGETFDGEFHMHPEEEVIYIHRGRVKAVLEKDVIDLEEGDTLRIPAGYKHRYINDTDQPAEILTIETL